MKRKKGFLSSRPDGFYLVRPFPGIGSTGKGYFALFRNGIHRRRPSWLFSDPPARDARDRHFRDLDTTSSPVIRPWLEAQIRVFQAIRSLIGKG